MPLLLALTLAFSLPPSAVLQAAPLGTAFTYQGKLSSGTNAANGSFDLKFSLYDAASGPAQVGSSVTNAATPVSNGLFTVTLDFGGGVFDGSARWLQIEVRANGAGTFTPLSPRQPLTPAPYALFASNTATLGGQAPSYYAPAAGSSAYVTKSGDTMSGPLNLPPNGLAAGGNQLVLSGGNVGIGTSNPQSQLHVAGVAGLVALRAETLWANAAAGVQIMAPGGRGELFFGGSDYAFWGGPLSLNFINVADGPLTFGHFQGGPQERMRITSAGNVGIGTSTPIYPLVVQKRSTAEPAMMIGGDYAGGPRLNTYGLDHNPKAWMGLGVDMSGDGYEHNLYFPVGDAAGHQSIGSYDGINYSEKMRITVAGNVGIGTPNPASKLEVQGGPIKATGGLIIETRTSDPPSPVTGQMWLIVP